MLAAISRDLRHLDGRQVVGHHHVDEQLVERRHR
jgi:hypothetical protein